MPVPVVDVGPVRRLKRLVGRRAILGGGYRLLARRYAARFEAIEGSPSRDNATATLVALNPGRFRGELEILVASGFRVLRAPYELQTRMLGLYFESGDDVLAAGGSDVLRARQANLRAALRPLLARLYALLGVDATIGAAVHYKQDLDWGAVSDQLGYPFIVLHRENLAASQAIVEFYRRRARRIDPFTGSLLVTHNETMRRIFVDSGYVPEARALAAGAMRMDPLVSSLDRRVPPAEHRRITFFSFGPGAGNLDSSPPHWPSNDGEFFHELCARTHIAILEFARANPDVEVVVKPKWGGAWLDNLDKLYAAHGLDPAAVTNLTITVDADAQELIRSSRVIVGFASTTLLESAVMGRPVIVPMFAEAADPSFRHHIMFAERLDIFDCASSPDELKTLLAQRLEAGEVAAEVMTRRRETFKTYVAPLVGDATARTTAAIRQVLGTRAARGIGGIG